ncbi:TIGR04283 family arsenosugar biosynthesis glycosyltransferase [Marinigracilibium pacificum]|uniref:Glycosyltransferase family 2 protein n=1 Tax=Marinigracilibium pacificum TaxID=2729599 RepID=A0A848J3T8_9BACT|nr:TIGR04283 family arsenosugar biosynthesis glycosyltransferase [Marinigracilibium pacificum]NMM49988.1 glycosyltransferase family 2 protein [Marinigracilibium pacificum]
MNNNLSVIIPVLNEEENLKKLIPYLTSCLDSTDEIIIVDGGSVDNSKGAITESNNIKWLNSKKCSRASQLNLGAINANNDILYFLHADARPPTCFKKSIIKALENGHRMGGFKMKLKPRSRLSFLRINSYLSGKKGFFTGGGDQSLFIRKSDFESSGGFNERYSIMEDFEFYHQNLNIYGYHIIQKEIKVSSRKYKNNIWLWVNFINGVALIRFFMGHNPEKIKSFYYKMLK